MHDGMPYGRNQGQGHSREVDRQSPMGLIFFTLMCTVYAIVVCKKITVLIYLLTLITFVLCFSPKNDKATYNLAIYCF